MNIFYEPMFWFALSGVFVFGIIIYALWRFSGSHNSMDAELQSVTAELRKVKLQLEDVRNSVEGIKANSERLSRRIDEIPIAEPSMVKPPPQRGTDLSGGAPPTTGANTMPMFGMYRALGESQASSPPAAPTPVVEPAPDFSAMLADYNRLSSDPRQLDAFEGRWVPKAASLEGDTIKLDDRGPLWLVRSGLSYAAVLPGGDVLRQWEKLYKPVDGMTAKNLLSSLYQMDAGTTLMVQVVALARFETNETLELAERGKLTGV